MDPRDPLTYIFSWKCVLLPGIAPVACLKFGIGQRGEARARGPSGEQGRRQ